MTAIGAGDWLEAVKDYTAHDIPVCLVKGQLYLCLSVEPVSSEPDWACQGCGSYGPVGLNVKGITPPDRLWCPCRFKPIYRPPGRELLEKLLMGVPVEKGEMV